MEKRKGFNKTEDTVFQLVNSQVSAVFMKKRELHSFLKSHSKWKWKEPRSHGGLPLVSRPESTDYAHQIPCWADATVSVEGFLKQFISQVEKMDCKVPSLSPSAVIEKEKSITEVELEGLAGATLSGTPGARGRSPFFRYSNSS